MVVCLWSTCAVLRFRRRSCNRAAVEDEATEECERAPDDAMLSRRPSTDARLQAKVNTQSQQIE